LSEVILKPQPLKPGDTIAVISPAGPADKRRLQAGLKNLNQRGYKVVPFPSADGRYAYFSAQDPQRLEELTRSFTDPDVKAIFCSRGGYGSGRLLDLIDYRIVAENPKLFIGFSDVTALNWAFFTKTGLVSFSGPTVCEFGDGLSPATAGSFNELVSSTTAPEVIWDGSLNAIRPGKATGRLFPGCLSIIVSLLGTPYLPDLTGALLIIEDVGEKPYRIDRMLTHLKNAGIFDKISALIIGSMVDCWQKKSDNEISLEEIVLDLTSSHSIPVYSGIPYGHHIERITLPVGVQAEISAENGLRLLEDPLSRI